MCIIFIVILNLLLKNNMIAQHSLPRGFLVQIVQLRLIGQ